MQPTRPLQGLRVLDLTQMAAGPFCTMLFADAGADVIKIERPGTGDLMREFGPFRPGMDALRLGGGIFRFSRNKRSIALDLRSPAGQDLLRELVKHADVVWENYAPGTMERFGLGYAQLREVNPRIIYAAISGFGHADIYESPYGQRAAYDLIAQALSGLMDITGQRDGPPTAVGTIIGDLVPALYCTIGVLMALRMREITGQGQLVDVAMYDAMAALCERPAMTYALTGEATSRGGETIAGPYDIYRARDGYVAIAAAPSTSWTSLCKAIGREDLMSDPRLATPGDRARCDESVLRPILEGWLAERGKVEASDYLGERGVAAAPVQTVAEMMACPHIAARRMVLTMEHPVVGAVRIMGNPVKMSAVPEPEARRVPDVGEHTDEVLREVLGYDAARIAAVRASGAVG
ncbi:MAG: CoA transferase [Chloroflexi bacterium]|nr:CoA transferase [Chloroflexota bacterium]